MKERKACDWVKESHIDEMRCSSRFYFFNCSLGMNVYKRICSLSLEREKEGTIFSLLPLLNIVWGHCSVAIGMNGRWSHSNGVVVFSYSFYFQ